MLVGGRGLFFNFEGVVARDCAVVVGPRGGVCPGSFSVFGPVDAFVDLVVTVPTFADRRFVVVGCEDCED